MQYINHTRYCFKWKLFSDHDFYWLVAVDCVDQSPQGEPVELYGDLLRKRKSLLSLRVLTLSHTLCCSQNELHYMAQVVLLVLSPLTFYETPNVRSGEKCFCKKKKGNIN